MGGGPAMRAAGKLTGMGVLNGGLRGGISAAQPAEQALRNVSCPAAAVVSTATSSVADVAAIQKASRVADWDFVALEEDLRVEPSPEPIARVVFHVPPTLQEAKDATADLLEAIYKVFLSSLEYGPAFGLPLFAISDNLETKSCNSCDSKLASVPTPAFGLPLFANSDNLETKSCNSFDSKLASVPTPAFKAFKLLRGSPAVQSIVASVAADQEVWDAVMKNQALKEYMLSQRNNAAVEDQESPRVFDESSSDSSPGGDTADTEGHMNKFFQKVKKSVVYVKKTVFFQKVKKSVVDVNKAVIDMVSNASDIFQKFLGSLPAERTSADAGGAGGSFNEKTMRASLMTLAIMVIAVVVLKRVPPLPL